MAGVVSDSPGRTRHPETCEVLVRGAWTCLTIDEALALMPERLKRCPACLGKLRAHRAGPQRQRAAFEHDRAHRGCPRDRSFEGQPSRHPKALF